MLSVDSHSFHQETTVQTTYLRWRESCLIHIDSLLSDPREDGQGMVEYALILVLIAIVVIVILQVVGKQVNNEFSNISNGLSK